MRLMIGIALVSVITAGMVSADVPAMHVGAILEQAFKDDDLAVVVTDREEMICEAGDSSPWGFCFAGFETKWRGPIELEVIGSGGYQHHDIFSFAGITLDYGSKDGWTERSHFGLGYIQPSRSSHPPSWGVGSGGKFVMRGNLVNAGPQPQRITLDPAKYAPKDWDGRLWIGLCTHNVGTSKYLRVRVLNASPATESLSPEQDGRAKRNLVREHQHEYLKWRAGRLRQAIDETSAQRRVDVASEMMPYAGTIRRFSPDRLSLHETLKAADDSATAILSAERFLRLVGGNADPYAACMIAIRDEAGKIGRLNGCLDAWKRSGRFGREIGCIIRTASNLEKVGLTDLASGRVVSGEREPIRISAARHEYEGFQIILTPLPGCAENVRVVVSDLTGAKGRIPKSAITVNPVGYDRIFEGEAREMLVADPLLLGPIPKLTPGENQPVWITVRIPDDAPSGEYRGFVRIYGAGPRPLNVPVALKVRDFAIPHKISLRSSFWMFRDQINRFYGLDEVRLDDYFKWIDMALEHRVCPIDVVEGRCTSLLDAQFKDGTLNPNPDFSTWDRYVDRMVAGGASTIHLALSHHYGAWFSDEENKIASPVQVQRVIESVKMLRDHYKAKGVFDLHYLQLRDETSAPESLNVYREVQKALPDVKLLLTAPSGEAKPFLSIPCPLTPGYDPAWQAEVKKNGGEYWWYVCVAPGDPAWANLFIHQTAAQHRALFWQTWSRGVDGLLYWGMNFWRWYDPSPAPGAKPKSWAGGFTGPNQRVPPKGSPNFCPIPSAPGDGFSMYPGPKPSQPLSSIRLEVMRDGEEDYEYFLILDRLIAKAESDGKTAPALAKARAARDEARKLVESMTEYPKIAAPYLSIREKVGDSIESLLH